MRAPHSRSPSIRESMVDLPGFQQPFLTWLTGMPLPGEQPKIRWSPWARLSVYLAMLAAGVATSAASLAASGVALLALPIGWFLTSGTQRTLYMAVLHNAVHDAFVLPGGRLSRKLASWINRWVAEIGSTILFVNAYDPFRRDHARWHHGTRLATPEDPDAQFLKLFGFGPGITRRQAWRSYWRTMFNPEYHLAYFKQRVVTNFIDAPPYRIAMAIGWNGALLGAVAATGTWVPFLMSWVFPLTVLYQQNSLTQMMSEHHWFMDLADRGKGGTKITFGRHLGERYPGVNASLRARGRWWARVLFMHLPARLWILVGPDLHVHDFHHRRPRADWANAAFERATDAEQHLDTATEYVSVWGSYADHMNTVFDRWAAARRDAN